MKSIEIGNTTLSNNNLYQGRKIVSLNHVDDVIDFLNATEQFTLHFLSEYVDQEGLILKLENGELSPFDGDEENNFFASQHYKSLVSGDSLDKRNENFHQNLQMVIGYHLFIHHHHVQQALENQYDEAFSVSHYIISHASKAAFVSRENYSHYLLCNEEYYRNINFQEKSNNLEERPLKPLSNISNFLTLNVEEYFAIDIERLMNIPNIEFVIEEGEQNNLSFIHNDHKIIGILEDYSSHWNENSNGKTILEKLNNVPDGSSVLEINDLKYNVYSFTNMMNNKVLLIRNNF